jgi:hypothetical protein
MNINTGHIPVRIFHVQDGFPPKLIEEKHVDQLPALGTELIQDVPTGYWRYTVTAVTQEVDGFWRIEMSIGHHKTSTNGNDDLMQNS